MCLMELKGTQGNLPNNLEKVTFKFLDVINLRNTERVRKRNILVIERKIKITVPLLEV